MLNELPIIQSIEQATRIEQLITPKGIETRQTPFITGRSVSEKLGGFFGKKSILSDVSEQLKQNGVAVIEGGYRSGKTSLLLAIGERLVQEKLVQTSVCYLLSPDAQTPPEQIIKNIDLELEEVPAGSKAVITFDEIEVYDKQNQTKLLKAIQQLREKGHMVVFSVIGDLHGDSPRELPRETKDGLLEMTNGVVTINRLLDENEMKELLTDGNEPLFTDPLIKYLVAQAGGHPFFANALAQNSFDLLRYEEIEPGKLNEELKSKVNDSVHFHFEAVVDTVMNAGFNPLTWEWKGQGEKPNVDVYVNMLPCFTSTIFNEWLTYYIKRKASEESFREK